MLFSCKSPLLGKVPSILLKLANIIGPENTPKLATIIFSLTTNHSSTPIPWPFYHAPFDKHR